MSTPPWGQQPHQPGQPQPFPEQAPVPPKRNKAKTLAGAGCLGVVGVLVLGGVISAAGGDTSGDTADSPATAPSPTRDGAKTSAPHAAAKKQTPQTVTYVVTGTNGTDVQYGPAGSSAQGKVPMNVTKPLGNPQYYSITAQLQGGGHVTCRLKVNGKVISQSTASGGYNIASCEISKDIFNGKWTDTNAG